MKNHWLGTRNQNNEDIRGETRIPIIQWDQNGFPNLKEILDGRDECFAWILSEDVLLLALCDNLWAWGKVVVYHCESTYSIRVITETYRCCEVKECEKDNRILSFTDE